MNRAHYIARDLHAKRRCFVRELWIRGSRQWVRTRINSGIFCAPSIGITPKFHHKTQVCVTRSTLERPEGGLLGGQYSLDCNCGFGSALCGDNLPRQRVYVFRERQGRLFSMASDAQKQKQAEACSVSLMSPLMTVASGTTVSIKEPDIVHE